MVIGPLPEVPSPKIAMTSPFFARIVRPVAVAVELTVLSCVPAPSKPAPVIVAVIDSPSPEVATPVALF